MSPSVNRIVTHPGGAHKDEVLAICILAAQHGAPIERRDPTPEDLRDPHVAVVDVGGSHDPALNNFDHHHFPREHPPTCSLSLLLEAMGLYEHAKMFCDWLEPAEWFDSRGPTKTARHLGVPRRAISQLHSPIDHTLLGRFAAASTVQPGQPLYAFMQFVGEDLLEYLRVVQERIDHVTARHERWTVGEAHAVFLPRGDDGTDSPSNAVGAFIRAQGLESQIVAIVYPDRRGEGYGIARYEDHPRLDFSRVEGEPDVHFAHKSGFMCKTTATDPERLKQLIAGAWTEG